MTKQIESIVLFIVLGTFYALNERLLQYSKMDIEKYFTFIRRNSLKVMQKCGNKLRKHHMVYSKSP